MLTLDEISGLEERAYHEDRPGLWNQAIWALEERYQSKPNEAETLLRLCHLYWLLLDQHGVYNCDYDFAGMQQSLFTLFKHTQIVLKDHVEFLWSFAHRMGHSNYYFVDTCSFEELEELRLAMYHHALALEPTNPFVIFSSWSWELIPDLGPSIMTEYGAHGIVKIFADKIFENRGLWGIFSETRIWWSMTSYYSKTMGERYMNEFDAYVEKILQEPRVRFDLSLTPGLAERFRCLPGLADRSNAEKLEIICKTWETQQGENPSLKEGVETDALEPTQSFEEHQTDASVTEEQPADVCPESYMENDQQAPIYESVYISSQPGEPLSQIPEPEPILIFGSLDDISVVEIQAFKETKGGWLTQAVLALEERYWQNQQEPEVILRLGYLYWFLVPNRWYWRCSLDGRVLEHHLQAIYQQAKVLLKDNVEFLWSFAYMLGLDSYYLEKYGSIAEERLLLLSMYNHALSLDPSNPFPIWAGWRRGFFRNLQPSVMKEHFKQAMIKIYIDRIFENRGLWGYYFEREILSQTQNYLGYTEKHSKETFFNYVEEIIQAPVRRP